MKYAIALFCFLLTMFALTVFGSHLSQHGLTVKPVSPSAVLVFDDIIKPWIRNEFKKDVSDELVKIDRTLLFAELYRYEVIDGEDRFNVHIEWAQRLIDRAAKSSFSGVKGQEIVFLVKGKEIVDFFPFNEYWIDYGEHLQT